MSLLALLPSYGCSASVLGMVVGIVHAGARRGFGQSKDGLLSRLRLSS